MCPSSALFVFAVVYIQYVIRKESSIPIKLEKLYIFIIFRALYLLELDSIKDRGNIEKSLEYISYLKIFLDFLVIKLIFLFSKYS